MVLSQYMETEAQPEKPAVPSSYFYTQKTLHNLIDDKGNVPYMQSFHKYKITWAPIFIAIPNKGRGQK